MRDIIREIAEMSAESPDDEWLYYACKFCNSVVDAWERDEEGKEMIHDERCLWVYCVEQVNKRKYHKKNYIVYIADDERTGGEVTE